MLNEFFIGNSGQCMWIIELIYWKSIISLASIYDPSDLSLTKYDFFAIIPWIFNVGDK